MSFAAFIVAAAVLLFAFAMAVGTITRDPSTDTPPPETVSAEQASSENVLPTQPAVTQPEADANADAQDDTASQTDAQPEPQAPSQQMAAVGDEPEEGATPATASAADPVESHDPSFPTHHSSAPAPAAAPASALAVAAKRTQ